jgi:hypothetical protein
LRKEGGLCPSPDTFVYKVIPSNQNRGKKYITPPSISIVDHMTEDERKKDRELITHILERRYDVLVVLS